MYLLPCICTKYARCPTSDWLHCARVGERMRMEFSPAKCKQWSSCLFLQGAGIAVCTTSPRHQECLCNVPRNIFFVCFKTCKSISSVTSQFPPQSSMFLMDWGEAQPNSDLCPAVLPTLGCRGWEHVFTLSTQLAHCMRKSSFSSHPCPISPAKPRLFICCQHPWFRT